MAWAELADYWPEKQTILAEAAQGLGCEGSE
jgi:hypothetical protein